MGLMEDFVSQMPFIGVVASLFLYTIKALRDQEAAIALRQKQATEAAHKTFAEALAGINTTCHDHSDSREEMLAGLTKRVISEMEQSRLDSRQQTDAVIGALTTASGGN